MRLFRILGYPRNECTKYKRDRRQRILVLTHPTSRRLEKYSWKDQESHFNETLPQFRVAIPVPSSEAPLRLHFVHVRSPHGNALPLLAIPPFPFTSLSFAQLVKPLTDPEDASVNQPFHLVIPSLPGLAYSDPLPSNVSPITTTAEMLNTLMSRLGYAHYLATNTGAASASPGAIDYRLARRLAVAYPASCLGTHLVAPLLTAPKAQEAPWEWAKWTVARLLSTGVLGYSGDDFAALKRTRPTSGTPPAAKFSPTPVLTEKGKGKEADKKTTPSAVAGAGLGLGSLNLAEPNTLAYALCDSPTGLLVFVLNGLRTLGPRATFTKAQIITFAQLAWVPGPEYALRFWAQCAAHSVDEEGAMSPGALATKPRVAITVFTGGSDSTDSGTGGEEGVELQSLPLLREQAETYSCPAWANAHYRVLHTQRTAGKAGLVAWERPGVIAAGVRGLAKEVRRLDTRLVPPPTVPVLAPLQKVVIAGDDGKDPPPGPATKLPGHDSPKATAAEGLGSGSKEATAAKATASEGEKPEEMKDEGKKEELFQDETTPDPVQESKGQEKGKNKELSPPPPLHDPLFSDSSPDTLVVNTPPLESSS